MGSLLIIFFLLIAVLFGTYCFVSVKQGRSITVSGFLQYIRNLWARLLGFLKSRGGDDSGKSKGYVPVEEFEVMEKRCSDLEREKEKASEAMAERERAWNAKYSDLYAELTQMKDRNGELSCLNSDLQEKVNALKEVARKLYPVSEESVSKPFCRFFQNLDHLILNTFQDVTDILGSMEDGCPVPVFESIASYLETEETLARSTTKKWHSLLLTSSAVTAEAALDIEHKNDEEILGYLTRVSFEQYFRPKIAAVLLLCEHVRASVAGNAESSIRSVVDGFLSTLRSYDIFVPYCKAGDVLDNVDYKDYEIRVPDDSPVGANKNTVLNVIHYGVDYSHADCSNDKTIVEMII